MPLYACQDPGQLHQLREPIGIRRPNPAIACARNEHLGRVYGTLYASLVIGNRSELFVLGRRVAETASGRIANNEVACQKTRPVHNRSNVHTLFPLVLYDSPSDTDKHISNVAPHRGACVWAFVRE
jgi:hypothetical protein